jgi:hypothetical protein
MNNLMKDMPPTLAARARFACEIAGIVFCVFLLWLIMKKPDPAPVNKPVVAQAAPEVADEPKVDIKPADVQVYAPVAKERVEVPAEVKADPAVAVLASDKLPESDHPETVTTVLDADTGKSQTYVVQDPYPWLAAENHKEVGMAYGFKNAFVRAGRLSFSDDFFQIKALHFGLVSTFDTDGEYFVGVRAVYRW